jgi:hypothetical protein
MFRFLDASHSTRPSPINVPNQRFKYAFLLIRHFLYCGILIGGAPSSTTTHRRLLAMSAILQASPARTKSSIRQ